MADRWRWTPSGKVYLGQQRLMDCNLTDAPSPPLRIPHHWVADGTGKTWCGECGVVRHPDFVQRDAALEERLDALRRKPR